MGSTSGLIGFLRRRDWRIWFGVVITILWIGGGVWFVAQSSTNDPNQAFTLEAIGSFLEGAFAPLAFLWLVLGLFIQQRELARNTEALRLTVEQSEIQTQAIAATEMNARQETFFKIAENVKHQLGGISGMLFVSGLGPPGSGRYSREETDELFRISANGDCESFARQFLSIDYLEEGGLEALFYETKIRHNHTKTFRRTFEKLLKLAEGCDVDCIISESLRQSAFGLLYDRMKIYEPVPSTESVSTPE
jgi:hypothetical protein